MPKAISLVPAFVVTLGFAVGFCARAHGELDPKMEPTPPCPVLLEAAITNHIAMTQVDPPSTTNTLRDGDSATFLGTLVLKTNRTQWLLHVEAASLAPKDKLTIKPEPFVVHMFGTAMSFESKPVPAKLLMLGPFAVAETSKPLKSKKGIDSCWLDESFLGVGLDQAAAVIMHEMKAKSENGPITNATAKLTDAEKRALAGSIPALTSYLQIVQHTEGLNDLLLKLVKVPSVWSIVRHGGVNASLFFGKEAYPANPADWNLPVSAPVYYLPAALNINGQLGLKVTFVVTTPHPPLLICGGVIGVLAEKPGDNETYMTLRVISARLGTGPVGQKQNDSNEQSGK